MGARVDPGPAHAHPDSCRDVHCRQDSTGLNWDRRDTPGDRSCPWQWRILLDVLFAHTFGTPWFNCGDHLVLLPESVWQTPLAPSSKTVGNHRAKVMQNHYVQGQLRSTNGDLEGGYTGRPGRQHSVDNQVPLVSRHPSLIERISKGSKLG